MSRGAVGGGWIEPAFGWPGRRRAAPADPDAEHHGRQPTPAVAAVQLAGRRHRPQLRPGPGVAPQSAVVDEFNNGLERFQGGPQTGTQVWVELKLAQAFCIRILSMTHGCVSNAGRIWVSWSRPPRARGGGSV